MTLAQQDRARWHHDELSTGLVLLNGLPRSVGYVEELRLQAAIAAEHARAALAADTNWRVIADLYRDLESHTKSPVVRLDRAVAVAEAVGASAGLALLDGLETQLPQNHRLAAVRADLARRDGDIALARASYEQSIEMCANETERDFLLAQLAALPELIGADEASNQDVSGTSSLADRGEKPAD